MKIGLLNAFNFIFNINSFLSLDDLCRHSLRPYNRLEILPTSIVCILSTHTHLQTNTHSHRHMIQFISIPLKHTERNERTQYPILRVQTKSTATTFYYSNRRRTSDTRSMEQTNYTTQIFALFYSILILLCLLHS